MKKTLGLHPSIVLAVAALVVLGAWRGQFASAGSGGPGDANCDGRINSIDAMLVLQSAAGQSPTELSCPDNGDVDLHQGLTSQDALLILQYHAALLWALPPDALMHIPTTGCRDGGFPTDSGLIANDIMVPPSDQPLLDRYQHDALAKEIDGVLALIRQHNPDVSDIHAWPASFPLMIVQPSPDLMHTIRGLVANGDPEVEFVTGNKGFDLLNARLGLNGVQVLSFSDAVFLCVSRYLNPPVAAAAYRAVPGIDTASADLALGDGSRIAAQKSGDTWWVLLRRGGGDCPAGCTEQEFFYFSVTDGLVLSLELPALAADSTYDALLHQMLPWLYPRPA